MKKNIIKITIAIIILFVMLFVINIIRNNSILNEVLKDCKINMDNHYYVSKAEYSEGEVKNIKIEIYAYNGTYLYKEYMNDELYSTVWYNSETDETITKYEKDDRVVEDEDNNIEINYKAISLKKQTEDADEDKKKILMQNLFRPFMVEDNCYVIKYNDCTMYIDKERNFIRKLTYLDVVQTFDITENVVTSDDVKID